MFSSSLQTGRSSIKTGTQNCEHSPRTEDCRLKGNCPTSTARTVSLGFERNICRLVFSIAALGQSNSALLLNLSAKTTSYNSPRTGPRTLSNTVMTTIHAMLRIKPGMNMSNIL